MIVAMTQPPAGWYPDPGAPSQRRLWDGTAWTDQVLTEETAKRLDVDSAKRSQGWAATAKRMDRATRPKRFYRRAWFWIVVPILVVVIAVTAAAGNSNKNSNGSTNSSSGPSGVSNGIGSQSATKDVTLSRFTYDSSIDSPTVQVTVLNHSSKRSDYIITVALESVDGKTQIDTGDAFVQNLESQQSSVQNVVFFGVSGPPPAGAIVKLQEVERTASN